MIYDGKVLLIRSKKSLLGIHRDPKMGWGKIFTGDFEICMAPGTMRPFFSDQDQDI